MNARNRRKLLQHRARADRLELELMDRSDAHSDDLIEASRRIEQAEANLSKMIAAREADHAKRTDDAMIERQEAARLKRLFERAIECLEHEAPASAPTWREMLTREDLWRAQRARMLHNEMATEPQAPGTATVMSAAGGTGGSFFPRVWDGPRP